MCDSYTGCDREYSLDLHVQPEEQEEAAADMQE